MAKACSPRLLFIAVCAPLLIGWSYLSSNLILQRFSLPRVARCVETASVANQEPVCLFTAPHFNDLLVCINPSEESILMLDKFPLLQQRGMLVRSIRIPHNIEVTLFPDNQFRSADTTVMRTSQTDMKETAYLLSLRVIKECEPVQIPAATSTAVSEIEAHSSLLGAEELRRELSGHYHHKGPLREAVVREQLHSSLEDVDEVRVDGDAFQRRYKKMGFSVKNATKYSTQRLKKVAMTSEFVSNRVIYFISPTYKRSAQIVDMVRLKQTLQLAALLHHRLLIWIVVEDRRKCSRRIRDILESSGLDFTHTAVQTNPLRHKAGEQKTLKGLEQRNEALQAVHDIGLDGVVYFGDDDNGYDVQLFRELAHVRVVGVFPVGFVGKRNMERCEVDAATGRVARFHTGWVGGRKFPVDMAGLALSTAALREHRVRFRGGGKGGTMETRLVEAVAASYDDLEPLAGNCTKVLAWHVRTDIKNNTAALESDPEAALLSRLV